MVSSMDSRHINYPQIVVSLSDCQSLLSVWCFPWTAGTSITCKLLLVYQIAKVYYQYGVFHGQQAHQLLANYC